MTGDHFTQDIQAREEQVHRLFRTAGTMYGLLFGLSFALLAWGYDAVLLASSRADLAWAKLLLGLPLVLVIGGLAGRLAASSASAAVSITLTALTGALVGLVAGHVPFDGGNLAAWLADRRLWGLVVFPYGSTAAVRTAFIVVIGAGIGAALGLIQRIVLEWSWDQASSEGKMTWGSWGVLFACVPLAFFMAWLVDEQINQPLRVHQRTVDELITLVVAGDSEGAESRGLNYTTVADHRDRFSDRYTLHLAEYDLDTYDLARVDVTFDNGFALRCLSARVQVGYCGPISDAYARWMDELIAAGLYGERRWLDSAGATLAVEESVVTWLHLQSDRLSEGYEVSKAGQRGGWVFMSARFDSGFEMACRFRGAERVVVDQCVEARVGPSQ